MQNIYHAITHGTPCVVMEGSGRVADVIAQVAHLPVSEITVPLIQQKLATFFQGMFETFTEGGIVEWTKKVRRVGRSVARHGQPLGAGSLVSGTRTRGTRKRRPQGPETGLRVTGSRRGGGPGGGVQKPIMTSVCKRTPWDTVLGFLNLRRGEPDEETAQETGRQLCQTLLAWPEYCNVVARASHASCLFLCYLIICYVAFLVPRYVTE